MLKMVLSDMLDRHKLDQGKFNLSIQSSCLYQLLEEVISIM
jgi:hypothetical protein